MTTDPLPQDLLLHYITLRQQCDAHADAIRNLANLLATLEQGHTDVVHIDTAALGYVHRLIVAHSLDILEALDGFIPLADAKRQVAHAHPDR